MKLLCMVAFLVCTVHVNLAFADDATAPEAKVRAGIELRAAGQDDKALALFQQAYLQKPAPSTLAQIGLAQQALGLWVDAEKSLQTALNSVADAWIVKNRSVLEDSLSRIKTHLGTLDVRCAELNAELFVDDLASGTLPLATPLRLAAGQHTLELRKVGFESTRRDVTIEAAVVARETIALVRTRGPLEPGVGSSGGQGAGTAGLGGAGVGGAGGSGGGTGKPAAETSSAARTLGFVALGVGGAALVTGGVFIALLERATTQYNDARAPNGTDLCPAINLPVSRPAQCQSYVDDRSTFAVGAIVAFSAGITLAAAGTILLLTAPSSAPAARADVGPRGAQRARHAPSLPCLPGFAPSANGIDLAVQCAATF